MHILTYSHSNGTFSFIKRCVIVSATSSEKVPNPNTIESLCIFVKSLHFIFNSRKTMKMNLKFS